MTHKFNTKLIAVAVSAVFLFSSCSSDKESSITNTTSHTETTHETSSRVETTKPIPSSTNTTVITSEYAVEDDSIVEPVVKTESEEKADIESVVNSFYSNIDDKNLEGALQYTTRSDDLLLYSGKAVEADSLFSTYAADTSKDDVGFAEIFEPLINEIGHSIEIKSVELISDDNAEVTVSATCFSFYDTVQKVMELSSQMTEDELYSIVGQYMFEHPDGELNEADMRILIIKSMMKKIPPITTTYSYSVYMTKRDEEWYVSGFSNNVDFIDMYIGRLSQMVAFTDLNQ